MLRYGSIVVVLEVVVWPLGRVKVAVPTRVMDSVAEAILSRPQTPGIGLNL